MPKTPKKRSLLFPFDLLVLLIRPNDTPEIACMFCGQTAEFRLDNFIRDIGLGQTSDRKMGGFLDMDAIWREAIHRQVEGDYTPTYYQIVCLDCCVHFAALQLGRRRPIQYFLKMASIARRQKALDLSVVILCTVDSFHDEGDLWAINAPSTDASAAMQHINNLGRETAKAEEPEPKEGEEDWKQRYQKRQRLLELRAQEIKATETLQLFLEAFKDLEQKEQNLGKFSQIVRVIVYGLFGSFLEPPEQEKLSQHIKTLQRQIEEYQTETQALAHEMSEQSAKAKEETA